MVLLCILSISGHFFLIKALTLAEAVTVQPFAYLHLVFASTLGVLIFGDALGIWTVIGGTIVVASGVFALLRARQVAR